MASQSVTLLAGPQLLGLFFNWGLQGVLIVQVYIYHMCFPTDRLALKLFVYGVLAFETVQTGLVTQFGFDIYVYDYGEVSSLIAFHNTWFSSPIMEAIIAAAVQIFFAWRLYGLSKSRILAGVIIFLALGQMVAGIVGGALLRQLNPSSAELSVVTPLLGTWLSVAIFVDIIIAASMTICLWKSKTGFKHSDAIMNRLIKLVVETGALTATVGIINVVLFVGVPTNLLYQCPALIISKVYANTLITNLNSRVILKRGIGVDTSSSHIFSQRLAGLADDPSGTRTMDGPTGSRGVVVDVRNETFTTHDIVLDEIENGKYFHSSEGDRRSTKDARLSIHAV